MCSASSKTRIHDRRLLAFVVREYLLIIVNKEAEMKEFHFVHIQLFLTGVCKGRPMTLFHPNENVQ